MNNLSIPCDYCPKEESGMFESIKICCPDGESVCYNCLMTVINASVQCVICERALGKKIGSLKSEAKQKLMGNMNQGQFPKRTMNKSNSSGNLNQSQMNGLNMNNMRNFNVQMHQMPYYPQYNPQFSMYPNPQWSPNCQNYQNNNNSNFTPNPYQNPYQFPPNNFPNMHPQQYYAQQQQQGYFNHNQPGINPNWMNEQQQNLSHSQSANQFKRQSMERLMKSASRNISQSQLMSNDCNIDLQGDEFSAEINYNNCYTGSYSGNRQPRTTDCLNIEASDSMVSRSNRSNSMSHTLRRK